MLLQLQLVSAKVSEQMNRRSNQQYRNRNFPSQRKPTRQSQRQRKHHCAHHKVNLIHHGQQPARLQCLSRRLMNAPVKSPKSAPKGISNAKQYREIVEAKN